jgi:hypothetical protein
MTDTNMFDYQLLEIKNMDKQLSLLINKYNEANSNYSQSLLNNVLSKKTGSNTSKFSFINGSSFWGSGIAEEGVVLDQDECVNMCLNNLKCTGATYNKTNNYCWARIGEGTVLPSSNENVALVPEEYKNLLLMKSLNQQITDLQKKKRNILNNVNMSSVLIDQATSKEELDILINNLNTEKYKMTELLKMSQTYNQQYSNNTLNLNSLSLKYRVLFLFVVVSVLGLFFFVSKK